MHSSITPLQRRPITPLAFLPGGAIAERLAVGARRARRRARCGASVVRAQRRGRPAGRLKRPFFICLCLSLPFNLRFLLLLFFGTTCTVIDIYISDTLT